MSLKSKQVMRKQTKRHWYKETLIQRDKQTNNQWYKETNKQINNQWYIETSKQTKPRRMKTCVSIGEVVLCAGLWQTKPAGTKSKQLGPNLLQSPSKLRTVRFFCSSYFSHELLGGKESARKKRVKSWNWELARGPHALLRQAAGKMKMESQEVAAKCGNPNPPPPKEVSLENVQTFWRSLFLQVWLEN